MNSRKWIVFFCILTLIGSGLLACTKKTEERQKTKLETRPAPSKVAQYAKPKPPEQLEPRNPENQPLQLSEGDEIGATVPKQQPENLPQAKDPVDQTKCNEFCAKYCPEFVSKECQYPDNENGLFRCKAECRKLCRQSRMSIHMPKCLKKGDCQEIMDCIRGMIPKAPQEQGKK